ncbi:MAG: transcriptional regulator, partial [Williamsia sp.]|nr:transcriptional regulator [Williamsia sp.]
QQMVLDAVFNAEHSGPGTPGHHRVDAHEADGIRLVTDPDARSGT